VAPWRAQIFTFACAQWNKITSLLVSRISSPAQLAVETGEDIMRKKVTIAVVALLAGALMLPNQEALARGGGFGGYGYGRGYYGYGRGYGY
jgi:hypothetical protein